MVDGTQLQQDVPDKLVWNLTTDGVYSSSSAYRAFFHGRVQMIGGSRALGDGRATKGQIFLLARSPQATLDSGEETTPWAASKRRLRAVFTGARNG